MTMYNPTPYKVLPTPGMKVVDIANQDWGIAEIASFDKERGITLHFYTSSREKREETVPVARVKRKIVPEGTRIYLRDGNAAFFGQVLMQNRQVGALLCYMLKLGGRPTPVELREDEFSVRSNLPAECSAVEELAQLAHETPFFFEKRQRLQHALQRHLKATGSLRGLLSAKVLLFPHQMQINARMGADPTLRYLLADEVGLGKTIEAGAAIQQALIDSPELRVGVFVPAILQAQWKEELATKFGLNEIAVLPHEDLAAEVELDLAVIDEAHRLVAEDASLGAATAKLSLKVKHLLLLTATPGLHEPKTMLRLLELLDPEHYSSDRLDDFKLRMSQRGDLGRLVLALQSAKTPAIVRRQLNQLSDLLRADDAVKRWASQAQGVEPGTLESIRDAVLVHVGEAYRLHHRMLRTRRKWVLDEHPGLARKVDVITEYSPDEDPAHAAWSRLESWRASVAVRLGNDSVERARAIPAYFRLASALASDPDNLSIAVEHARLAVPPDGKEGTDLDALGDAALARQLAKQQAKALTEVVRHLSKGGGAHAQGVVFCPNAKVAARLAIPLQKIFPSGTVALATQTSGGEEVARALDRFHSGELRILLTDQLGEEGLNLQSANFMVWVDLPWSPIRLEQRVGRLDRIDRTGKITCRLSISGEDEELYLDEAWRQLVADGLGIFRQSISDLAHVVSRELPIWEAKAFEIGPVGLGPLAKELQDLVARERVENDEQDVIDGMQWLPRELEDLSGPLQVESEAAELEDALAAYLQDSLSLLVFRSETDNCLVIKRDPKRDPLIPVERLKNLAPLFERPITAMRAIACECADCTFFRPGHPAFHAVERLLQWDDRGRAFAMWRFVPDLDEPRVVFRCEVRCSFEIAAGAVEGWGSIEYAQFQRQVAKWIVPHTREIFLDPSGSEVDEATKEICLIPYKSGKDISLGKEKAVALQQQFGAGLWRKWCLNAETTAVEKVGSAPLLQHEIARAIGRAEAYFSRQRTIVRLRAQTGWSTGEGVEAWDKLEDLTRMALRKPVLRVESIGAYVLSSKSIVEAA